MIESPKATTMATPPQLPVSPKKTNPLLWILAAVLGLFLLMVIAVVAGGLFVAKKVSDVASNPGLAAVKLMVAANPDIELVSSDENKGTFRIREKKTGRVLTVDFDQIRSGKLVFEEDGQKVSLGGGMTLPDWLPVYPGAISNGFGTQTSGAEVTGMVVLTTSDSAQKVFDFYQNALKKAGITELTNTTTTAAGALTGTLVGRSSDERRSAQILFGVDQTNTSATITWSSKK